MSLSWSSRNEGLDEERKEKNVPERERKSDVRNRESGGGGEAIVRRVIGVKGRGRSR